MKQMSLIRKRSSPGQSLPNCESYLAARDHIQMSLIDPLLSVTLFCHLASITLCALILSETLALYKSFTYLLTYLHDRQIGPYLLIYGEGQNNHQLEHMGPRTMIV